MVGALQPDTEVAVGDERRVRAAAAERRVALGLLEDAERPVVMFEHSRTSGGRGVRTSSTVPAHGRPHASPRDRFICPSQTTVGGYRAGDDLAGRAVVRALLCGMRGSTPAPGVEFAEVGGNTSCVAIPAAGGRWLLLDAGTGMARLAGPLDGAPLRATILLTHLHWDHTHGLPFLPNADRDDAEIDVLVPAQANGDSALATMARAMSPPHFPVAPDGLLGTWRVPIAGARHGGRSRASTSRPPRSSTPAGARSATGSPAPPAAWRTCPTTARGWRHPSGAPRRRRSSAASTCCCTAPGTSRAERAVADDYGHATVGDAVEVATAGGVGRLVLIHHAPRRTDAEIAAIGRDLAATAHPFPVEIGREGTWVDVGRAPMSSARRAESRLP